MDETNSERMTMRSHLFDQEHTSESPDAENRVDIGTMAASTGEVAIAEDIAWRESNAYFTNPILE
jgi:hypothetical protein